MLSVDKFSRIPIYEQIVNGVEQEILTGLLHPGDQVTSIRELSANLGINPNTIQRSYLELNRMGILQSSQGNGYFVSTNARDILKKTKESKLSDLMEMVQELAMAGLTFDVVEKAIKDAFSSANSEGE